MPDEPMGLHTVAPPPGAHPATQAPRARRGIGIRQDRRSRPEGCRLARRFSKRKAGYEGGQNPLHMRMRKLRGPNKKMSMPFEMFRTHTQPVNLDDLEARFDDGADDRPRTRCKTTGLATPRGRPGQGPRPRRAHQEVHRARPQVLGAARARAIEGAGGTCQVIED